jgi:putative ABC transport system substrate-binding protein
MRALRRVASPIAVALLAVAALAGCSDDESDAHYRVAILRAVAGVEAEERLFDGLAEGGVRRDQVEIIGGRDRGEMYPSDAAATEALETWVDEDVDAVIALSTSGARLADDVTGDTPVLFISSDPSATGLVRNERAPEGHLTGMSYRVPADRTLALLSDAFPGVRTVGCLYPPADPAAVPVQRNLRRAAGELDLALTCEPFTGPDDAPDAARALLARTVDAVVLVNSPTTSRSTPAIAEVLAGSPLPVVGNTPADIAELTLAPDAESVYVDMGRQLARLLQGTPVAEVPVQDPGDFRIVVNEVIARQKGHEIPAGVLREATEVIR